MNLFSVPISIASKRELLAIIGEWVQEFRAKGNTGASTLIPYPLAFIPKVVVTPNPEIVVAAQSDPTFLRVLQNADLSIADGWGVAIAMRLLQGQGTREEGKRKKENLPSRVSGIELMEALVEKAALKNWSVMLIGGGPQTAHNAARKLEEMVRTKSLTFRIVSDPGPLDIEQTDAREMNTIISTINQIKPDLLFVGFGHKKQEVWMETYKTRLTVGVMMGVGGAFDQLADPTLRPPHHIDSMQLGWLYRLLRQPWRHKRQRALLRFLWIVLRAWFRG